MSKEEFLKELEAHLRVLNDQERKDVLEEYAQHINMKIESGLSEEEAVRDFGDPAELIAELLDAYHINSDLAAEQADMDTGNKQDSVLQGMGEKIGHAAGHMAGEAGSALHALTGGFWHFFLGYSVESEGCVSVSGANCFILEGSIRSIPTAACCLAWEKDASVWSDGAAESA